MPHGPTFFTAEWRELYKHTLREADRACAMLSKPYRETDLAEALLGALAR